MNRSCRNGYSKTCVVRGNARSGVSLSSLYMAEKQEQAGHAGATRLWWLTVLGSVPLHAYYYYSAVQMILTFLLGIVRA